MFNFPLVISFCFAGALRTGGQIALFWINPFERLADFADFVHVISGLRMVASLSIAYRLLSAALFTMMIYDGKSMMDKTMMESVPHFFHMFSIHTEAGRSRSTYEGLLVQYFSIAFIEFYQAANSARVPGVCGSSD